jgi:hypothetical protein
MVMTPEQLCKELERYLFLKEAGLLVDRRAVREYARLLKWRDFLRAVLCGKINGRF